MRDKIRQEAERVAIRSMQVKSASRKSDTLVHALPAGRRYPLFYLKGSNVKEKNVSMIWMHLHKLCFMIASNGVWGA